MNIPKGTRIKLIRMPDDPQPIPAGTIGTVKACSDFGDWAQLQVQWDNGRHLMLCVPPDQFEIVD